MAHYSLVTVTPQSDQWIPSYIAAVGPLLEAHGGRYLARTASVTRREGSGPLAAVTVIVEWPSKDAEEAFYTSPEYAGHLQARMAGSESEWISISGQDDFAG